MNASRIPRTPARARIKVKDEAELERWRKLVELVEDKKRRRDATKSGRAKSGRAKSGRAKSDGASVRVSYAYPNSDRSEIPPEAK
jgi:hypothetical protein